MNKYKNTLLFATALVVFSSSMAQAGTLTVINKLPKEDIKLCIQSELNPDQTDKNCYSHIVKAGAQEKHTITKECVRGNNTYKVIAARLNVKASDWNLMGATCSGLITDADYTITIDSTLGKLSCTQEKAVLRNKNI
jgi:hypothetical protein